MMTKPILELKGVCKRFGGVVASDYVDFSVYPGSIHALIGPNGAGKTTMLNLISGIYQVDEGEIHFGQQQITKLPAHQRSRLGMGRTFQAPRFLQRANIRENLLIAIDLKDQAGHVRSFLGKGIVGFESELKRLVEVAELDLDLGDDITSLAYGQSKLLEIVRAMLARPKVMLVDEPAAGLNGNEQGRVIALLKLAAAEGIGVVLIEHHMDMVISTCNEITVLNFGKVIAEGDPQSILHNEHVIEAYLGRKKSC